MTIPRHAKMASGDAARRWQFLLLRCAQELAERPGRKAEHEEPGPCHEDDGQGVHAVPRSRLRAQAYRMSRICPIRIASITRRDAVRTPRCSAGTPSINRVGMASMTVHQIIITRRNTGVT